MKLLEAKEISFTIQVCNECGMDIVDSTSYIQQCHDCRYPVDTQRYYCGGFGVHYCVFCGKKEIKHRREKEE